MGSTSEIPLKVSQYSVIPLQLPALPSLPTSATHYLYLRRHEPKLPHPDSTRSLFLVNIPIDSTEQHFRALFGSRLLGGGRIERVEFEGVQPISANKLSSSAAAVGQTGKKRHRKRKRADIDDEDNDAVALLPELWDRTLLRSGSSAVAVFVDRPSMEAALKASQRCAKHGTQVIWGDGVRDVPPLGSRRYTTHKTLTYPPAAVLQEAVSTYLSGYSSVEAARDAARLRARTQPDADGFITVTRGGRSGPAKAADVEAKAEELKKKQEEKSKGMVDFYRYQIRERKKKAAGDLVGVFERDRQKVDEVRRRRRDGE